MTVKGQSVGEGSATKYQPPEDDPKKPWINAEVRAKLRAWAAAYNSGDPASYKKARYDLQRTIRLAKRSYRDRVEYSYLGSDLRHMWSGLRTITDYKEGVICDRGSSSSPNTSPAEKLPADEESCALAIPLSEVVRSFRAVNPHKAPGP
ncbi:hypothetical protein AOLI_G00135110 [Acnodon oligacanthus]